MRKSFGFAAITVGVGVFSIAMSSQSSNDVIVKDNPSMLGTIETIQIGLGSVAKEMCSCVWVVGRDVEACREFAALDAIDSDIKVDEATRVVTAKALWVFSRSASFDPARGCGLVP